MNYENHYSRLIEKAKDRILTSYKESHHIVPRSMGGSDDANNLVDLTAREHFIAHWLLARIHGGPMIHAFWFMTNKADVRINGKTYEWLRKEHAKYISSRLKGQAKTPEHIANLIESLKKSERKKEAMTKLHEHLRGKSNHMLGKKQDPEWIAKRVEKLKGQTRSDEAKSKMSSWVRTEETKQKIADKLKGNTNRKKKPDVL
jgi:hypothetical protein